MTEMDKATELLLTTPIEEFSPAMRIETWLRLGHVGNQELQAAVRENTKAIEEQTRILRAILVEQSHLCFNMTELVASRTTGKQVAHEQGPTDQIIREGVADVDIETELLRMDAQEAATTLREVQDNDEAELRKMR